MKDTNWVVTGYNATFTFLTSGLLVWCANLWIFHIGYVNNQIVLNASKEQLPGFLVCGVLAFVLRIITKGNSLVDRYIEVKATENCELLAASEWLALSLAAVLCIGIEILAMWIISA